MAERRTKKSRFGLGMIVYALIVIAAALVGMRVLWNVLAQYEASRPAKAIEAYMADFGRDTVAAAAEDFLDSLDETLRSRDESLDIIMDDIGEVTYAKKSAESSETENVYVLKSGDRVIGRVVTAHVDDMDNRFGTWTVRSQEMDFEYLRSSSEQTVPDGWALYAGDTEISADRITEADIQYEGLDVFYKDSRLKMPTMTSYSIDGFIGELEFSVKKPDGTVMPMPEEGIDPDSVLNNCSAEETDKINAFISEYFVAYINFYTNSGGAGLWGNFAALQNYLLKDGELEMRLRSAMAGLEWSHNSKDNVKQTIQNRYIRLADGYYIAEFTNIMDTQGSAGVVEQELHYQMLLVDKGDGLKAVEMYTD